MTIQVYNNFEEVEALWRSIEADNCGYAFQNYDWLYNWYQWVGKKRQGSVCIAVISNAEQQPLYLFPFWIIKKHGLKELQWLGGEVTDYMAPLPSKAANLSSNEEFSAIWTALLQALPNFDYYQLVKQPELIHQHPNPMLSQGAQEYAESYAAELKDSWSLYYESQVKKRIRADSRRQRKRLEEIAPLRFVIARTAEQVEQLTKAMITQKRRRYAEMGVTDIFDDEGYHTFFQTLGSSHGETGIVHLCALYCGETIIATHWGIAVQPRFYFLMPTYEGGDWKRFSAGRILLEELIQWCFNNQYEVFDFSLGDEAYKQEWCNLKMPLYETTGAGSLKGALWVSAQTNIRAIIKHPRINPFLKNLKARLMG